MDLKKSKSTSHSETFTKLCFSTSVELEPGNVCVCLCLCLCLYLCLSVCPTSFGHSRKFIHGQICLKFGIIIAWVNPWGCFFLFSEILDFRILGTCTWTLNGPITLWALQGSLKWSNLSEIWHTYRLSESLVVFFLLLLFWTFWFLGPGDSVVGPNWTKNVESALGKPWMVTSVWHLGHLKLEWIPGGVFVFLFFFH